MHALLAIDGSPKSISAARFLASLPFREPPHITVLTALIDTQFDLATTEAGVQIRAVENETSQAGFATVKAILEPVASRLDFQVQRQHPSQLILDVSKELDVDLIVLGSMGHSTLYRMTLGSTADYVSHHAKCSTLVVRSGSTEGEDVPIGPPFKIMLAYDESPGGNEAFSQLKWFAWPPETSSIHITMKLERPKLLTEGQIYDPDLIMEKENVLKTLCSSESLGCEVTHSVDETVDISSAIYSQSNRLGINLLFAGDTGRSAISRFFVGSTARYLSHHAECSFWIARQKQWD